MYFACKSAILLAFYACVSAAIPAACTVWATWLSPDPNLSNMETWFLVEEKHELLSAWKQFQISLFLYTRPIYSMMSRDRYFLDCVSFGMYLAINHNSFVWCWWIRAVTYKSSSLYKKYFFATQYYTVPYDQIYVIFGVFTLGANCLNIVDWYG